MGNKQAVRTLHIFQMIFKIFLIISTFGMSVHCANLLMGIRFSIVEVSIILPLFPFVILMMCTYVLKLCNLARCILCYNYLTSVCIYLQKNFQFFDKYLTLARWIVMVSGIIITIFLVRKMYLSIKRYKCEL